MIKRLGKQWPADAQVKLLKELTTEQTRLSTQRLARESLVKIRVQKSTQTGQNRDFVKFFKNAGALNSTGRRGGRTAGKTEVTACRDAPEPELKKGSGRPQAQRLPRHGEVSGQCVNSAAVRIVILQLLPEIAAADPFG
ncbi:MAG: hypothetical protein MPJ78_19025 [Hyphomicrobiaceae bacterium]|nr:hypothetical protein [Hyphomicrobiaceae bacterium]